MRKQRNKAQKNTDLHRCFYYFFIILFIFSRSYLKKIKTTQTATIIETITVKMTSPLVQILKLSTKVGITPPAKLKSEWSTIDTQMLLVMSNATAHIAPIKNEYPS